MFNGVALKLIILTVTKAIIYDTGKKFLIAYDTIRYDTRCYFNVRLKADISQLNLPHGTDN